MRPRRLRRFWRPRLEHLEDRRVLACQVLVHEHILFILGDETSNNAEIVGTDNGLRVTCDTAIFGPFAGISAVKAELGEGHDTIDVQMSELPDVLHVLTGKGNDDVSLVFANNPNIPPIPREPNAPMPEIMVDVGAGVDSVMLDVFGSLQPPPPSDSGDVSAQVTLLEVLAAIQITGVGLLANLTLFPLGAVEMAQSVKDDRAGNTKTNIELVLDGPDLTADITTHATLDSIHIGLTPQPESKIDLNLKTGREDDRIDVRSTSRGGPLDWSLNVEPGPGLHDEVLVAFEHGEPDRPIIIGSLWNGREPPSQAPQGGGKLLLSARGKGHEFFVDFDLIGSSGIDDERLDVSFPPGDGKTASDINIATAGGKDRVSVNVASAALNFSQNLAIDTGGDDDQLTVNIPAVQTDGLDDLIVGPDLGGGPHVKAFDGGNHAEVRSFFAYDPSFAGGVRVATGDVNGDGVPDIITGAGPGAGPHVKVFDGRTNAELMSFFAYPGFTGGVFVAAGDFNGDGRDDIVTGADSIAPHVKVFDGATGGEIRSFLAFPGFAGGVRVAAGDVNGDGRADIITGAGPGAGPHVKVFDGRTNAELASFFAYG